MKYYRILFFLVLTLPFCALAQLKMPKILGDHMVLQRDQPITVWGWAKPKAKVQVSLGKSKMMDIAASDGSWKVTLPSMVYGGPYVLSISSGKEKINFKDILIGDVWLCGGQSNMEWTVVKAKNPDLEKDSAVYDEIRIITVEKDKSYLPKQDISGGHWKLALKDSILDFSAIGYFFGRQIYQKTKIPQGLISSNWGGTNSEAWTSKQALYNIPYFKGMIDSMPLLPISVRTIDSLNKLKEENWVNTYLKKDQGVLESWFAYSYSDAKWSVKKEPDTLTREVLKNFKGNVWYRKTVYLPQELKNNTLFVRLGKIQDFDILYVNGKQVARTYNKNEWRSYKISKDIWKADSINVIAVRVFNAGTNGGMVEPTMEKFSLSLDRYAILKNDLNLSGDWKYKLSNPVETSNPIPKLSYISLEHNLVPSLLYNSMIYPLANLKLKGCLWYQGEANAHRANEYKVNFPLIIQDWRKTFSQDQLPFFLVQLANYRKVSEVCVPSDWAELREAQAHATRVLPMVGMATAIDLGLANDIHPTNKQDVAKRLAWSAMNMVYKDTSYPISGPVYHKHQVEGSQIKVTFDHVGKGLVVKDKYGYIKGFSIAGADQKFYWAKAKLMGKNTILVGSSDVPNPVAVRYAWADNPDDINLYSLTRLPVLPFRTDNWKPITEGVRYK